VSVVIRQIHVSTTGGRATGVGPLLFFSNRGLSMKEPVSCLLSMTNRTGVVWLPEESGLGFLVAQREVGAKTILKFGPLSQ